MGTGQSILAVTLFKVRGAHESNQNRPACQNMCLSDGF